MDLVTYALCRKLAKSVSVTTIKAGGVWSDSKPYLANTTVSSNGNVYMCIQDAPAGTPVSNTAYWQMFLEGIPDGDDRTYVHEQTTAAATWTITHNMDKYPSVTIIGDFDNGKESVLGDIEYTGKNSLTISFDEAIAGTAYLN